MIQKEQQEAKWYSTIIYYAIFILPKFYFHNTLHDGVHCIEAHHAEHCNMGSNMGTHRVYNVTDCCIPGTLLQCHCVLLSIKFVVLPSTSIAITSRARITL